jgi:tryptophan 2,3-dioxygenase
MTATLTPAARIAARLGLPETIPLTRLTDALADRVRRHGKQRLSADFFGVAAALRETGPTDPVTAAFLEGLLDKYDGRYHYHSYLGLPLLTLAAAGPSATGKRQLSRLLVADAVRFELDTAQGRIDVMPRQRPDAATLARRVRHGLIMLGENGQVSRTPLPDLRADGPETVRARLPEAPTGTVARILRLSVLPVDTLHDEYLFLRILQAYEMLFAALRDDVRAATREVRAGSHATAADMVDRAAATLRSGQPLFRMLATMGVSAFRTFREFTEGASAIQSHQYKEFEVACGMPTPQRLNSAAFDNAAPVRDRLRRYPDTLEAALREADGPGIAEVSAACARLEIAHQQWKSTHHSLAARMLGDAPGSGYTAGVPYLREVRANRLFPLLDLYPKGDHALPTQ